MTFVEAEIASQPDCWRDAAALAATPEVRQALPRAGERVAVVGCGTSLFMAQCFAVLREGQGMGETDAWPASEFPTGRRYDRIVALTRSGTTTEVRHLLQDLSPDVPSTVITADATTPVVSEARASIVLDFADERSVVQTRFATSALALWRAWLGEDLAPVIDDARSVLDAGIAAAMADAGQFTFLGTGWTVGLANEAALKIREASQSWAESYPAMEFRHGPISVIDDRSAVWFFGPAPDGLLDELRPTGAALVPCAVDPMAHLIGAQLVAVELAQRKGLDPDHPRNLTRSIVLSS